MTISLTSDRFRLLWSHHQRCAAHHSLTEVNEIHVSKKETASVEDTVRLSAVQNEMERPARSTAQNERIEMVTSGGRRSGGGGGEER